MKIFKPKTLKKAGTLILSLVIAFVLMTPAGALAQDKSGAEVGGAGLGAAGAIGPVGVALIAVGTLAAVAVIAEAVTDSDSTSKHKK